MKTIAVCFVLMACLAGVHGQTATTTEVVSLLKKESESAADQETKSLAGDFSSQMAALSRLIEGNPNAQTQLAGIATAVAGGKGGAAVEGLQKLATAKFTPEQTRLAKEVYNVGSAYLAKKNLSSVDGAQTEVNQIVASLRKGAFAEALPPLKKISQSARLTQPQKDLVSSMISNYAPALGKVGEGLKGLPGLKK